MTDKIAIIGSGLIGRAWATVFAGNGFAVALYDAVPGVAAKARAPYRAQPEGTGRFRLVEDPKASLARIRVATDLADAAQGREAAQESGPETVEAKRALFAEMDRLAPKSCILASSTSFIIASRFAEGLPGSIAAWWRIRSTRRISCRLSSWRPRPLPHRRRWNGPARSMKRRGRCPSCCARSMPASC